MESSRLSIKAFALTSGILWGAAVLIVGLIGLVFPGYGLHFLKVIGSIYFHPDEIQSVFSVLSLAAIALFDGAIAGLCFAWIYNYFVGKSCTESL